MNFTNNLLVNIYSIVLLVFICFQTIKDAERKLLPQRLYFILLLVTVFMLIVDIFSRFDGNPGTIYSVINHIGNFLIFLFNPFIPSLWLLYAHFQVFHEEKRTKRLMSILLAISAFNIILLIMSQYFGWLYYIDSENIYHRGPLFWVPVAITVALAVSAFVMILKNRRHIERKHFFSILLFPVPPLVCLALQVVFYGTSLMLNGVAFSLVVVFVNIQNLSMNTDYLTGAYNRKRLEIYMREKISTSTENKTFSAILIDFDNFKFINDTFGHDVGDYVLENFVKLFKSCLGAHDFIARYGGDEFCIILDISDKDELEAAVCKINLCIDTYNKQRKYPYQPAFSMGYAVYDFHSHLSAEEFQKHIDILMYENKRARKEN